MELTNNIQYNKKMQNARKVQNKNLRKKQKNSKLRNDV